MTTSEKEDKNFQKYCCLMDVICKRGQGPPKKQRLPKGLAFEVGKNAKKRSTMQNFGVTRIYSTPEVEKLGLPISTLKDDLKSAVAEDYAQKNASSSDRAKEFDELVHDHCARMYMHVCVRRLLDDWCASSARKIVMHRVTKALSEAYTAGGYPSGVKCYIVEVQELLKRTEKKIPQSKIEIEFKLEAARQVCAGVFTCHHPFEGFEDLLTTRENANAEVHHKVTRRELEVIKAKSDDYFNDGVVMWLHSLCEDLARSL